MNNGQTFEALVAEFYQALLAENSTSQITTQERIAGPDGLREFDIVIRTSVADFESITLVECKDYGRLVSVETIDAFASKLADFSGNKGILISRKGFSKNAIQKAKRCGIDVCTIDKAKDLSTISEYNLPVFFRQIDFENFTLDFIPLVTGQGSGVRIDANNLVSGFGIMDLISIIGPHGLMQSQITVDMSALLPNVEQWLMGTDGQRKPIENARIEFTPKSPIYFGFASELPSTMLKKNEINNETVLLIGIKDFADISSRLRPYDSFEGTPEYARKFFLSAAVIPERVDSVGSIKMFARSNL